MSCGNKMHADNCPCDNDVVEEPQPDRCQGWKHVAGRLVWCDSTDDLVDGLCVACTAEDRERTERFWADNPDLAAHRMLEIPPAEEATPEPVVHEETTERIPVETLAEVVTGGRR